MPSKGIVPTFQEIIQCLKPDVKINKIIISDAELRKIFDDVFRNCKLIKAAGGLVVNNKNQVLMIKRFGVWDLPKGKIEKNERIYTAAIREVEEECSVKGLQIVKKLPPAYHVYTEKNQWILKKTYWFLMKTNSKGTPVPQAKEHITEALWCSRQEVVQCLNNTYGNIRDVICNGFARGLIRPK